MNNMSSWHQNRPAIRICPSLTRLSWMVHDTLVTAPQQPRDHTTTPSWIAQEALVRSTLMGRGMMGLLHFKNKSC